MIVDSHKQRVYSLVEFIKTFGLEREAREYYGMKDFDNLFDIYETDKYVSDESDIEYFLEKMTGKFIISSDTERPCDTPYWDIYRLE